MSQRLTRKSSLVLVALLTTSVTSAFAFTQPPPPGGPDGGGPGGPGGQRGPGGPGGGGRGQRGGMGMRQQSLVQIPVPALTAALKLTADQEDKIKVLNTDYRKQRDAAMPKPGEGEDRPDPEQMQAAFQKLRTAETASNKKIEALLTDDQKSKLPALYKKLQVWNQAGLPADLYSDLKLTDAQYTKIAAIIKKSQPAAPSEDGGPPPRVDQKKVHEDVLAVLNDDQKALIADWEKTHPRMQFGPGGPGGPGGRRGPGGPGGGPDGGGPGGPPPGGGEGGPPPENE